MALYSNIYCFLKITELLVLREELALFEEILREVDFNTDEYFEYQLETSQNTKYLVNHINNKFIVCNKLEYPINQDKIMIKGVFIINILI